MDGVVVGTECEIRVTGEENGYLTHEPTGRFRYLYDDGSVGEWFIPEGNGNE